MTSQQVKLAGSIALGSAEGTEAEAAAAEAGAVAEAGGGTEAEAAAAAAWTFFSRTIPTHACGCSGLGVRNKFQKNAAG